MAPDITNGLYMMFHSINALQDFRDSRHSIGVAQRLQVCYRWVWKLKTCNRRESETGDMSHKTAREHCSHTSYWLLESKDRTINTKGLHMYMDM